MSVFMCGLVLRDTFVLKTKEKFGSLINSVECVSHAGLPD